MGLDDHLGPAGDRPRRDVHRVEKARASQDQLGLGQQNGIEAVAGLEEEQGADELLAGDDVQGGDPAVEPGCR